MNVSIKILSIILFSYCLMSCQTTSLKIGSVDVGKIVNQGVAVWDANNINEDEEIQFGRNMSAVLLGARPLTTNEEVNRYVNKIGMWLALNTERSELPWRFGVIDSEAINAFAAPGGYIFITSGMLVTLQNEAQLAAVLAHEISHVIKQHHLNELKAGSLRTALTETLFISADAYQQHTGSSSKDKQYTQWAKTVTSAAQDLYIKGLSRQDEYDADDYGIKLLAKSGYDPFAFIANLQILEAISPDDTKLALMYKTHPTPTERLASIQIAADNLEPINGKVLTERFVKHVHTNRIQ